LTKIIICVSFLFLVSLGSNAQELKKKWRGTYLGTVPSYYMEVGEKLLEVSDAQISITFLEGNKIQETLGSSNQEGIYRITSETKTSIIIQVNYANQLVYEVLEVSKKEKTIIRKGFYPQPECKLVMTK
jgi:hypothetical protein